MLDIEGTIEFLPHPLVGNLPCTVIDSENITLLGLAKSKCLVSANLPPACKILYEIISKMELDCEPQVLGGKKESDWPKDEMKLKLSDAMRYSLNTEGCLLYEKLKEKKNRSQFGNPKETYLRITAGCSVSNSPGIPYVLEIWPSGHYSPIHNHGNASAVIKVMHGTINASVYNKQINTMHADSEPLTQFDLEKGQVTWMSKEWFQTHKLWNRSDDYCATIQCYQYEEDDTDHWPFFDYVSSAKSRVEEFLPNTDITFLEMREKVLEEYGEYVDKRKRRMGGLCHIICKFW